MGHGPPMVVTGGVRTAAARAFCAFAVVALCAGSGCRKTPTARAAPWQYGVFCGIRFWAPPACTVDPSFYDRASNIAIRDSSDKHIALLVYAPIPFHRTVAGVAKLVESIGALERNAHPAAAIPDAVECSGDLGGCACTAFELGPNTVVTAGYALVGDLAVFFELYGPAHPSPHQAVACAELRRAIGMLSPAGAAAETERWARFTGLRFAQPLALGSFIQPLRGGRERLVIFCREDSEYRVNLEVIAAPKSAGGVAAALRGVQGRVTRNLRPVAVRGSETALRPITLAGRQFLGVTYVTRSGGERAFLGLLCLSDKVLLVELFTPRQAPDQRLRNLLLRPIATFQDLRQGN